MQYQQHLMKQLKLQFQELRHFCQLHNTDKKHPN